jgi:hypothetical protein
MSFERNLLSGSARGGLVALTRRVETRMAPLHAGKTKDTVEKLRLNASWWRKSAFAGGRRVQEGDTNATLN